MFCPECGNKMENGARFCNNCGYNVEQIQSTNLSKNPPPEKLTSKIIKNNPLPAFLRKNKKIISVGGGIFILTIIGIILFYNFYDFTSIKWDENSEKLKHVTVNTNLNIGVKAKDKEENEITDIKFKVSKGEVKSYKTNAHWILPREEGKYKITAIAPSGKKITKTISVVVLNDEKKLYGVARKKTDPSELDSDGDGIIDSEEKRLKLNPYLADTDMDGIADLQEINQTKTDPLKKDSDGDGLSDGDELDLGLDPLKKDSKGDGIEDGKRTVNFMIIDENNGLSLEIQGKGNIARSTIDILPNSSFRNINGLTNKLYNLSSDGKIIKAVLKIKYDKSEILNQGLNEDNLTIYNFNEKTNKLEIVKTTVDKENQILIAELTHFSQYLIGDSSQVAPELETKVIFLLDNSLSMYTNERVKDFGLNCNDCEGNDVDFKRIILSNKLIDMFQGNYKFGAGYFLGQYIELIDFTDEKAAIKLKIKSIEDDVKNKVYGTNIIEALNNGISKFSDSSENNYIILLTDGQNTIGNLSLAKASIIESAKGKNVRVCIIGLGKTVETDTLREISTSTSCDYYYASNATALDDIYAKVAANINYNQVDTDGDNKVDGMISYDSGFITSRDGFSFDNFGTTRSEGGHCYGMAEFALLNYTNKLPQTLEGITVNDDILSTFLTTATFGAAIGKMESSGYDLSNTYFFKSDTPTNKNLYDLKMTDLFTLYDIPDDYRKPVQDNGIWYISDKYIEKLNYIGSDIFIQKYTGKDPAIKEYQRSLINPDSDNYKKNVSHEEQQIMAAIYRLYITQFEDRKNHFSYSPDSAYNELIDNLSKGIPVIVTIDDNHGVNAIRLIRDLTDTNKFKIEVYDNNYSGKTRYIEVTRSKYSKWQINATAWNNEYEYKFEYDGENVPVGLRFAPISN